MTKKRSYIVIGLGYGDEGKGLATDYLCANSKRQIVIRFNGGQQAGHTVVNNKGQRHIFSNFGSGTLRGIPTYWSRYCSFSPIYLLSEYRDLTVQPTLYLDKLCPVTTHYDVLYNRAIESTRGEYRYGSCGQGYGATIDRHSETSFKLLVSDLFQQNVLEKKLQQIKAYYQEKTDKNTKYQFNFFNHTKEDKRFKRYIGKIEKLILNGVIRLVDERDIFQNNKLWETYIFEGAQGILLDEDFGFRPYVTKSNTTSKNALEMLDRYFSDDDIETEIFYVTRAYLTRHGGGPFFQDDFSIKLRGTRSESNRNNPNQGVFKRAPLNIQLLNYALNCDASVSKRIKKNIVVTCLDQLPSERITIIDNTKPTDISYMDLPNLLDCNFNRCKFSFSSCADAL